MDIAKGNEEYCKTLGLFGESLQIKDPLFDMIKSMVRQPMDFENLMLMTLPEPSKIPKIKEKLHQYTYKHINI